MGSCPINGEDQWEVGTYLASQLFNSTELDRRKMLSRDLGVGYFYEEKCSSNHVAIANLRL